MLPEVATDLLPRTVVTAHVVAPMVIFVYSTFPPDIKVPEAA